MKKRAICSLALTAALASAAVLSACGGGDEVTFDREAPAFGADADVTISVQAKKKAGDEGKISDTLFGVFLEDINYASYYLDDDLIMNGSFEAITRDKQEGWTALANTTKTLMNDANGIFANTAEYKNKNLNPNYLKVAVGTAGSGGLKNTGYQSAMPMTIIASTEYKFSAFIKSPNKSFDMNIRVTDGASDFLTGSFTVAQSNEWVKYTRTFTATDTKDKNLHFELSVPADTEFFIDGVALETMDSTIGIKNTPYNAIKDLAPKFIRFPGGCIIEGNGAMGEECAYDWKNSIGAVQTGTNAGDDTVPAFTYKLNENGTAETVTTYGEAVTRKHNPDLWAGYGGGKYTNYYDMTYAIGFYEYFLLCESLGASAVPVLNCGYSCMGGAASNAHSLAGRHGKKVEDFIQDAIDLIEFAKGGTDTKWGAIRANLGHPAPFEMSYLGIGNEQWDDQYYKQHYQKFLEKDAFMDALDAYSIKPIVGNATQFVDCEQRNENGQTTTTGMAQKYAQDYVKKQTNPRVNAVSKYGVVDQHYYVNYTKFLENTHMYDHYVRPADDDEQYYEVFVGEYSANADNEQGFSKYYRNQWICALSEAAMMTGFERNGDIVKLAAYAPMFGTAIDFGANGIMAPNQWGTDMMYFTGSELVLSTNYFVQQLFMKNQGAYRILDNYVNVEWNNGLSSTFDLAPDVPAANATKTVDKIYYVASFAENGDIIIKIVNVSGDTIKADLAISELTMKGNASVTVLQNDDRTVQNTLSAPENIAPESYTIGAFSGNKLGYEIKPYSVTSITVHAK